MPLMTFPEIFLRYSRHPPLRVAALLRNGRPAGGEHHLTHNVLLTAEEAATTAGHGMREIREEMRSVLGVSPENLSRPLNVDEAFALCERLGIDLVLTLTRAAERTRDHTHEEDK